MTLLTKELKLTIKSLTFWIVIAFIAIFLYSQIGMKMTPIKKPEPNQDSYGTISTTNKTQIQKQTYANLLQEYVENTYSTYPFTFVKEIQLTDKQNKEIAIILEKATRLPIEKLQTSYTTFQKKERQSGYSKEYLLPLTKNHSYVTFEKDMETAVQLIGNGSYYERNSYLKQSYEPMTYKQAVAQYNTIIHEDKVTGAYARIVCDYMGIILALVPAFIGATVILRDRRSMGQDVIFTKVVASGKLITIRYFATVLVLFAAVLLLCLNPALQSMVTANRLQAHGSLLLFYEYIIGWNLPTILAVIGISFLLTECFGGIISLLGQFILFMSQLLAGSSDLIGNSGWNLIPRFNEVGSPKVFQSMLPQLVCNRIAWSTIGILCVLGTVFLYDYQRKGGRLPWKKILR